MKIRTKVTEYRENGKDDVIYYTPQYKGWFFWYKIPNKQRVDGSWYCARRNTLDEAVKDSDNFIIKISNEPRTKEYYIYNITSTKESINSSEAS